MTSNSSLSASSSSVSDKWRRPFVFFFFFFAKLPSSRRSTKCATNLLGSTPLPRWSNSSTKTSTSSSSNLIFSLPSPFSKLLCSTYCLPRFFKRSNTFVASDSNVSLSSNSSSKISWNICFSFPTFELVAFDLSIPFFTRRFLLEERVSLLVRWKHYSLNEKKFAWLVGRRSVGWNELDDRSMGVVLVVVLLFFT